MDNQIKRDGLAFSLAFVPAQGQQQHVADYTAAYVAGANQLRDYFEQFMLRVEKEIGSKASEFERGQVDGIRWFHDQVLTLFGED